MIPRSLSIHDVGDHDCIEAPMMKTVKDKMSKDLLADGTEAITILDDR